jgi:hypothetical protein
MGINFQLEEPHREICNVVFESLRTWEDFDAQMQTMAAAILATPCPVAVLMDMTGIGHLPDGNALAHLQWADSLMPGNVDIAVLVNAPYAFVNFISILMRIRPHVKEMTFFAHSLDEGNLIIRERCKHNTSIRH